MTRKHKLYFIVWSFVHSIAMASDNLRNEYNAYTMRAWNTGLAAMDSKEWLHRRWFPKKYAYEVSCPACGGITTSYGLCMDCGNRWDVTGRPARPM